MSLKYVLIVIMICALFLELNTREVAPRNRAGNYKRNGGIAFRASKSVSNMRQCVQTIGKVVPQLLGLIKRFHPKPVMDIVKTVTGVMPKCQSFRDLHLIRQCGESVISTADFIREEWFNLANITNRDRVIRTVKDLIEMLEDITTDCLI